MKKIKIGSLIRAERWVHGISGIHREAHGVVIRDSHFFGGEDTVQVCWSNGTRQWVAKDRLEVVVEL